MKGHWKGRCLALVSACCVLLAGCGQKMTVQERQIFAMDTVMQLSIYAQEEQVGKQALEQAVQVVYTLEQAMDVTQPDSQVGRINAAGDGWVEVDGHTWAVLAAAQELARLTGGALDITAYPAVRAWGFTTGEHRVPGQQELGQLAGQIDYTRLELDENGQRVHLPQGMELDLGAVAKGYAGDVLEQLVKEQGVEQALFRLGGNIHAVGSNPEGRPWRVGIQDPDKDGYLAVVEVEDQAVVTSGGYQRYFEQDGQRYWHIMDPHTAAPARSGLASVTVVGENGLVCDGLSTALFVMGLEQGTQFWRDNPQLGVEVLFITQQGQLVITQGLEEGFSLAQGYEDREVTVIR